MIDSTRLRTMLQRLQKCRYKKYDLLNLHKERDLEFEAELIRGELKAMY